MPVELDVVTSPSRWGDIKRGASMNYQGVDLVEIFGDLGPADQTLMNCAREQR